MLKRSTIFAAALVASLSLGLTAMAMPAIDTVITQGYDAEEMALIFGVPADDGDIDSENDCDFSGTIQYTAGTINEETSLTPVTVDSNAPAGGSDSYDLENCDGWSTSVTGPNGQINHGTFQSAFVHALKALNLKGMGCLVGTFSKLGYGDVEKLTTAEAREAAEAALAGTTVTGEPTPTDIMMSVLSCDKGKDKAPGLAKKDANSHGPAWKTDNVGTHPSQLKGQNKDK